MIFFPDHSLSFFFFSFRKYSIYLFGIGSQLHHAHLLLQFMGSLVVLCELVSWPGIKPKFPALEGWFLTTGPPGKTLSHFFNQGKITHTCKKKKRFSCKRKAWSLFCKLNLNYHYFKDLFIYFTAFGLRCCVLAFSSCSVWASQRGGFSCWGALALGM